MSRQRLIDMEILNLSSKSTDLIGKGTAIGTGLLAWEYEATKKAHPGDPSYGLFTKWRFADAFSTIAGPEITTQIFGWSGLGKNPELNLFKAANKTTFTGIAIVIADSILKELWPAYKRADLVTEVVHNAGIGLAVGGAVGGIFDPDPSDTPKDRGNGNPSVKTPRGAMLPNPPSNAQYAAAY